MRAPNQVAPVFRASEMLAVVSDPGVIASTPQTCYTCLQNLPASAGLLANTHTCTAHGLCP